MLNCHEVTQLCSQELERPLGLWERVSLRAHLMMCDGCSNFRDQMGSIREAMRAYAEGRAPSGDRQTGGEP
jgi:predicted anti-sigma-YlaC factor YlaD